MDLSFVVFDLDGTVFKSVGVPRITSRVERALKAAHDSGLQVVCASGRPWMMAGSTLRNAPWLDWHVGLNGADITNTTHEHVLMRPIAEGLAGEILEQVRHPATFWNVAVPDAFYFEFRRGRFLLRGPLAHLKVHKWDRRGPIPRCYHVKWIERGMLPGSTILKMDLVAPGKELQDALIAEISCIAEPYGGLEIANMSYGIELTAKGVTKATGVHSLLEMLDLDPAAGVVFGDSANDLSLTHQEWTFVAMANSSPEILCAADDLAPSVFDDGVAVWLERALGLPSASASAARRRASRPH